MNADTFRTLAVVFLALAIVLAIVAVVLYRVFDIRAVRDALTGRTAAREIADLRGVRAGSWQHADEFGKRGSKRGSDTTSGTTGSHETSDIEFRPVTGTGSGSFPTNPGETLEAAKHDDETRAGAGAKIAPPAAGSTASGRHAQGGASARDDDATRVGTSKSNAGRKRGASAASAKTHDSAKTGVTGAKDDNGNPLVEIPVKLASAAELADEGETSLMQFRKTDNAATDDEDESRTILVRGGKNK